MLQLDQNVQRVERVDEDEKEAGYDAVEQKKRK